MYELTQKNAGSCWDLLFSSELMINLQSIRHIFSPQFAASGKT